MLHAKERQDVVDACLQMRDLGLVVGTAGNVSVRVEDHVIISPSGVAYEDMTPEDVGVHDLQGNAVDAALKPSSELPLHLAVYARTDVGAITHNHAPASTALGLLVDEVPTSHYYTSLFGGPVRVAPYAHFGSQELADSVAEALEGRTGALMANHGAITVGPNLPKALSMLPYLEYICEVQLRAMAASAGSGIKLLSTEQIESATGALRNYGQESTSHKKEQS